MAELPAPNQLLEDVKITRALIVNWRSYAQSQMISEDDFNFINELDSADDKQSVLRHYGKNSAQCFANLIGQISRDQTVRYLLTLIDDLLSADKENIYIFHEYAITQNKSAWAPFMNLLSRQDNFISHQAARITAKLTSWGKLRFSSDDLASYLSWLKRQISSTSSEWLTASTSALMIILRVEANREAVIRMGIVEPLLDILKRKCGGFQLQYQIICCFWLISFSCANELLKREVTVPTCDVLRETEKQKVSRVCLALFRNLLEKGQDSSGRDIAAAMISCKIQKSLQVLQDKTLDDSEMEEDLAQVFAKLQEVEQSLSSYEEFCSEVTSGRLSWSPVHTNNRFWRENAQRLVEKDYFVLRRLTHILETDQNTESLSVGCHDLGEFVRYYPRGRQVIDKIAAKQTVMQLMTHEDQTVRYNALIAVQKMMVNNWEILGRQIAAN